MTEDMIANEANVTEEFPVEERIPLLKAVRLKCLDCSCFQPKEVALCPVKKCTLYPYRFGKDPYRQKTTRVYTPEEREAARQRMAKINSQRKDTVNQSVTTAETD